MSSSDTTAITSLRFLILCGSIICYALGGFPTPDNPGLVELIVGAGLLLSLGLPQNAFSLLTTPKAEPLWMKSGRLLLIYGLSVPLLVGVLNGNAMGAILRDIFPFLFLLLPFFAYDLIQRLSHAQINILVYTTLLSGMIFALRGLYILKDGAEAVENIDALYLVNAPTVLFAALYLSGFALVTISTRKILLPLLAISLSLLPISAMGAVLQRASFGAIAISGIVLSTYVLRHNLLRFTMIAGLCATALLLLQDTILPLLEGLVDKNRAVGSNMRFYELLAVWERVADSSLSALFGQGWGGTVQSPAVGGLTVNFTHSLISAALLKTGLVGTILTVTFLGTLFLRFPLLFKISPVMALALFWPYVIDIFLYASYKSLDFGFILLLIATYGVTESKLKQNDKAGAQNINDQQGFSTNTGGDRTHPA